MKDEQIVQMYLERDENAIKCTAEKYGLRLRQLSFGITSDKRTSKECAGGAL